MKTLRTAKLEKIVDAFVMILCPVILIAIVLVFIVIPIKTYQKYGTIEHLFIITKKNEEVCK